MDLTQTYIISQILTIGMYITLSITYWLHDRKQILIVSSIGQILICGAYLLLAAYSGALMAITAVIRNIVFLIFMNEEKENSQRNVYIFTLIMVLIGIAAIITFDGLLSLLSVIATILYSYSVWQNKTLTYKLLGIPNSLLWGLYNLYVGSIMGVLFESVMLVFALSGYISEKSLRKPK